MRAKSTSHTVSKSCARFIFPETVIFSWGLNKIFMTCKQISIKITVTKQSPIACLSYLQITLADLTSSHFTVTFLNTVVYTCTPSTAPPPHPKHTHAHTQTINDLWTEPSEPSLTVHNITNSSLKWSKLLTLLQVQMSNKALTYAVNNNIYAPHV